MDEAINFDEFLSFFEYNKFEDYSEDYFFSAQNQVGKGDTPPLLNLNLRKSPSFEKLIDDILLGCSNGQRRQAQRKPKHDPASSQNPMCEKMKATNFPASLLKIGDYTKVSEKDADLVCKCYYAKQKLVWEILEGSLKRKLEIHWSNIARLRATIKKNEPGILEIELNQPPLFYLETDPEPRKHTIWKESGDFTGGEASRFRRHYLEFRPFVLDKHYEKLLDYDHRLSELSRQDYPSSSDPFFRVPSYFNQLPNTSRLNAKLPRLDSEVSQPPAKYMRPMIQPQRFHPSENTASFPYCINDLTSPSSETSFNSTAGRVFHRQVITNPNSPAWPQIMIPMESPLEAYNLSLSESAAFHQLQNYNNSMVSNALIPSLSHDIGNNAMFGVQFPSADNAMADGSQNASMMLQQMVTMVDPSGLPLRSSEAHNANICNEMLALALLPSSVAPIQDPNGYSITCLTDNNSLQYVSEDTSSMAFEDAHHRWTYDPEIGEFI